MLRSRRVADLLLSLLSSGAVASSERAMILQVRLLCSQHQAWAH